MRPGSRPWSPAPALWPPFRAHPAGFDALEALVPRMAALATAGAALARLGRPWALPADDGAPAVLRLARLARG